MVGLAKSRDLEVHDRDAERDQSPERVFLARPQGSHRPAAELGGALHAHAPAGRGPPLRHHLPAEAACARAKLPLRAGGHSRGGRGRARRRSCATSARSSGCARRRIEELAEVLGSSGGRARPRGTSTATPRRTRQEPVREASLVDAGETLFGRKVRRRRRHPVAVINFASNTRADKAAESVMFSGFFIATRSSALIYSEHDHVETSSKGRGTDYEALSEGDPHHLPGGRPAADAGRGHRGGADAHGRRRDGPVRHHARVPGQRGAREPGHARGPGAPRLRLLQVQPGEARDGRRPRLQDGRRGHRVRHQPDDRVPPHQPQRRGGLSPPTTCCARRSSR